MHFRPRTRHLVVVALASTALLAGCAGGTTPAASESDGVLAGQTWAYGSPIDASPMFKALGDGIVSAGEDAGATMLRYDNNVDAATELANGKLMVQQGADLVIDWAASSTNEALGMVYSDAGVPCIAVGTPIPGCPFFNIDGEKSGVGLAEAAIAESEARGWDASNTTALLVSCLACGKADHLALEYFYSTYAAAFPELEQLTPDEVTIDTTTIGDLSGIQVDGAGSLEGAFNAVSSALLAIPEGRNIVIYANNDDMATGALRAIDEAGRNDSTILGAQGSTVEALNQVRDPASPWIAESSLFFSAWPKYLTAMGLAVLDGAETPDITMAPGVVVTADNIDDWFDEEGMAIAEPEVPDADAYLVGYFTKLG